MWGFIQFLLDEKLPTESVRCEAFYSFCRMWRFLQFLLDVRLPTVSVQGWEFAHWFFEQIARFLWKNERIACFLGKNERMSDTLKKTNDSLIRSFLVSNLSKWLMVALFWWATWANRLWSLIFSERPEPFAQIAHFWWATWSIRSHRSPKKRE